MKARKKSQSSNKNCTDAQWEAHLQQMCGVNQIRSVGYGCYPHASQFVNMGDGFQSATVATTSATTLTDLVQLADTHNNDENVG